MRRNLFIIAGALTLVVAAVMLFTGFGFAQADGSDEGGYSYGVTSDGVGPELENRWGTGTGSQEEAVGVAADDGDCCCDGPWGPERSGKGGHRYGESSLGAGPGLENRWGPGAD